MLICSYLSGAIPTGYWVAKAVKGIDIRKEGSGSTGATNVLRCVGKKSALFVFFVDIFKGYAPVAVSMHLQDTYWSTITWLPPYTISAICAFLSIFGHSRSIFLQFQGGKSAATTLGALLALNPLGGFSTFMVWLIMLGLSRIVSLASIVASVACPIIYFVLKTPPAIFGFGTVACFFVIYRHRANVKRLIDGTEPKIGQKAKVAQQGDEAVQNDKTTT